jgi:hypothetical protein
MVELEASAIVGLRASRVGEARAARRIFEVTGPGVTAPRTRPRSRWPHCHGRKEGRMLCLPTNAVPWGFRTAPWTRPP